MSRRELILAALGIFAFAMIVRIVFAAQIVFPKPEDTAYYVGVAQNLIEGRGLVSDSVWSYQTPPLEFPRPAFEVWMPLPTFLAVIPMLVFGSSFGAAQISSVIIGASVPVLAWRLAADIAAERGLPLGRARTLAIGTGLTTALYLPLLLHSALPDSTMPFTAVALGSCLLIFRIARHPRGARLTDPRLIVLGGLLGLAALTRNEAIWLAIIWAGIAWFAVAATRPERLRLVGVVAVLAMLVFAPWAARNWIEFGSPLPGQAATNALSISGVDIFAWNDPPTLSRYLAVGPQRLVEMRLEGIAHNVFNVLLFLGLPISLLGLAALPWTARGHALRPVLWLSVVTFLFTSLVFPVATTWGTFLHAAGPVHVLLVISALLALDSLIARLGHRLGWERPVAWLGAALGVFASALFSATLLLGFGSGSEATARYYDALGDRMAEIGHPLDESAGPVISNFPIWIAESQRVRGLALPDEPPNDVLDLAAEFPGTRLLVLTDADHTHWPADLDAGAPGSECFAELDLGVPPGASTETDALAETRVFEIICP